MYIKELILRTGEFIFPGGGKDRFSEVFGGQTVSNNGRVGGKLKPGVNIKLYVKGENDIYKRF